MKKMILATLVALSLAAVNHSMLAYAGMSNSVSESFEDDLPEIEIEEPIPEVEETEVAPEEPEDSKEQETEAPEKETEDNKSEESEPETEPEKTVVIRDDNDNTPENPVRTIRARRNVVICDNEPIEVPEETTAVEETEESISETVVETEEIETVPETLDHKVPEKSSLPKTADFSDLMIAGVAVLAIVAAAFAVVANRRKANA